MRTLQQRNRHDAYCRDSNDEVNNTKKYNVCVKIEEYNITGMERSQVVLLLNNRTINKSFGTRSIYKIRLARWKRQMETHR